MKSTTRAPLRSVMPFFVLAVVGFAIVCSRASFAQAPGTVAAWGYGANGQIGDGTPLEALLTKKWNTYVAVQGLDGVMVIAAGHEHSLAVKSDGTVWAWGLNLAGQIGDGGGVQRTAPVRVPNLTDVRAVAGGSLHSLALKADGTVWAWGSNLFGEQGRALKALPNNLPDINQEPTQIQDLTGMAAVAAGENYSVALKADGSVWAWGMNTFGQLGNGSADGEPVNAQDRPKAHPKPAPVQGLSRIVAIAAGASHALALDAEGAVWAWGLGSHGQTGFPELKEPSAYILETGPDGKPRQKDSAVRKREWMRATPSRVAGLGKVKAIAAGDNSSLALAADGTVWAWGANTPRQSDQLERAQSGQQAEDTQLRLLASGRPVQVAALAGIAAIGVGRFGGMALQGSGTVWGWGDNYTGQLGTGNDKASTTPVQVKGLTGVNAIAVGLSHTLAAVTVTGDPYLQWYSEFSELLEERKKVINKVRSEAGMIAAPLEPLRKNNLELIATLRHIEAVRREQGQVFSEQVIQRLKDRLERQSGEVHEYLRRLDTISAEANQAMREILAKLEAGFDAHGTAHLSKFIRWKKLYGEMAQELPFELAVLGTDRERFLALVDEGVIKALSANLRTQHARILLDRGELARAITELRSAVRIEPENALAQKYLAEAEITVMRHAMEKSDGALARARGAFEHYLTATGHGPETGKPRALWARALMGPLDESNRTLFNQLVLHGVVNICDRIAGRLGGEELKLETTTLQMTRNFLALNVMVLLRAAGYTLPQIRQMTSQELQTALPLNHLNGQPYTLPQVADLRVAMNEAMGFEDIAALMDENVDLMRVLGKPYFNRFDVVDTSIDSFGSALVRSAILMALPMAQVKVGGEMVAVGELFANAVRWNKAMQWLGGTKAGEWILAGLAAKHRFEHILLVEQEMVLLWGTLKTMEIAALMVLQAEMIHEAEKHGGPAGAAVVEAMLLLSNDTRLMMKWLAQGGIVKQRMIRIIDAYSHNARTIEQRLEEASKWRERARQIHDARRGGRTLTPAESGHLQQRAAADTSADIPSGSAEHDVRPIEQRLAQEGLGSTEGGDSGVRRILENFEKRIAQKRQEIQQAKEKATQLRAKLEAAPEPSPTPPPVSPAPSARVNEPVPGFFHSINPQRPPRGWKFQNTTTVEGDLQVVKTNVKAPDGTTGWFECAYDPKTKTFEMRNAFLQDLPGMIDTPIPMVDGKGTPTAIYAMLYQMKKLGASYGGLSQVKLDSIFNVETVIQYQQALARGAPKAAITETAIWRYADSVMTQSGHRLTSASVDMARARSQQPVPIDPLLTGFENQVQGTARADLIAQHDALLRKYGVDRSFRVQWGFNVNAQVEKIPPAGGGR